MFDSYFFCIKKSDISIPAETPTEVMNFFYSTYLIALGTSPNFASRLRVFLCDVVSKSFKIPVVDKIIDTEPTAVVHLVVLLIFIIQLSTFIFCISLKKVAVEPGIINISASLMSSISNFVFKCKNFESNLISPFFLLQKSIQNWEYFLTPRMDQSHRDKLSHHKCRLLFSLFILCVL